MSSPATVNSVSVRLATPQDAEVCGRICYEAFAAINRRHNFPPDIPVPEAGIGLTQFLFSHPGYYSVVAESDGRILGSSCMDERSVIAGIGPVTVDPAAQDRRVGRMLMEALTQRARDRRFAGVRLLQSAFHNRSLALYTKLGFASREPMSVMQGPPINAPLDGCTVRAAIVEDLESANSLCRAVHGHDRAGELREAVDHGTALVVERNDQVTGYVSLPGFFGHAVAVSNLDLQALIAAAPAFAGPGFIVPTRNYELFRWCLESGLRIVYPMTLMTTGHYREPAGAYLPSIAY
jgi:predicted N-acetyltransferase YhbS